MSFSETDTKIDYELHPYYYTTVNAKGKVIDYCEKSIGCPDTLMLGEVVCARLKPKAELRLN